MLVGLRISEGRLGVQIGRWGFSLRFGVQIGRWGFRLGGDGGFRLGGGGSDWVWKGFRLGGRGSNWGWRGFRLAEVCGEGSRVQIGLRSRPNIATFARDQESGKTHKSELNPLRPI